MASWSDWYKCEFDSDGNIDLRPVEKYAPNWPGLYAIAMKDPDYGDFVVHYIGMSKKSIWKRLKAHFSRKGSPVIRRRLEAKKDKDRTMSRVDALYFMFLETSKDDAPWMEALYIKGTKPIANVQQELKLPTALERALRNSDVNFEPEDD